MRHANGIVAAYKMVDTCAAEFAAETPYYYSVFGSQNEVEETSGKKKVLVLGSGPIRIGQGIEFDFCSVHCTWAFAKEGYETIIVNNNPETVSNDFDRYRETGRSSCTVRWTDSNQTDRSTYEDGSTDPWYICRECRQSRRP